MTQLFLRQRFALAATSVFFALVPCQASAQELSPGAATTVQRRLSEDIDQARTAARALRADLQRGRGVAVAAPLQSALDRLLASDLLLAGADRALVDRLAAASATSTILARQAQISASSRARLDLLRADAEAVHAAIESSDAARLTAAVDLLLTHLGAADAPAVDRTPIGVTLPYRPLNLPAAAPALGPDVVPAYLRSTPSEPVPADLAAAIDVPLGGAIAERAAALQHNPIAIFEFVQTQISTELYHGAMKGAAPTLAEKSGNDVDQASLLVALLRASAVPARYVRGVIRLTAAEAQAWAGVSSARRVSDVLTRAGIPFTPVRQGGVVAAFNIEHTWVDAYVPYANYRGAPLDPAGRAWVPLDPSFKPWQVAAAQPIPPGLGFTGDTLVAEYLSTPQTLSPVDFYTKKLVDHLAQGASGLSLNDVLFTRTLAPTAAGLLPSTLPYQTVSVNAETSELPAALRHTVRFLAEGDEGTAFDVTVPVSDLLGRRLTLSYVPATVEDQIAANAFLGLDNTPAYLLKLRPVLRVGGAIRAAGEAPVQMGNLHRLTLELRTPRATVPVTNSYIAGGYYAIGIAAAATRYEPPTESAPDDDEPAAADLLYRQAATYLTRWNDAERSIAAMTRVVPVMPMVSEVVVGNVYNRTLLFGQPQEIAWRGVFVDADLRISEPVPDGADDTRARDFRRMSALAGSDLESRVLEESFGVDAVSAAKLIQLANAAALSVRSITSSNVDTELPLLQTVDIVKADIADGVRQGWTATIPQADLSRHAWSGIGYVMSDAASGAAGYFISGGLAGGMSSQDPAEWVQQQYVRELGHPYQDPPNTDSTAAFSITKVVVSDQQEGTAGAPLQRPLSVWIRDAEGKPVQGATVTFRIIAGGGLFAGAQEKTATTDVMGIASAKPTLGQKTSDAPFFVQKSTTDTYTTQVGENLVQARVTSSGGEIALAAPFQVFGFPDAPARIIKVLGDLNRAIVGTYGGTVRARLVDQFDNPISNADIDFTVGTAVPDEGPLPEGALNMTIFPLGTCENRMPTLGDCNAKLDAKVETSVFGASVETIMGDTVATKYSLLASAAGVSPVSFTLHSAGNRDYSDPGYLGPSLTLTQMTLVNDRGQLLNAAEAGTEFKRPLGAVVMLAEDHFQVVPNPAPCGPTLPQRCFRIDTTQTMRVRPVDVQKPGAILYVDTNGNVVSAPKEQEHGSVSFTVIDGGGTVVPATASQPQDNPGGGRYHARLTVGAAPALNRVELGAQAQVWAPRVNFDTGAVTPVMVTLQPGDRLNGFEENGQPNITHSPLASRPTQDVFGVRARLLNEENVLIGGAGGTTSDFELEYRIEPSGYNAQSAEVDLFEKRTGDDAWLGVLPGTATQGDGKGLVHQGTGGFNPSKAYGTQLVLNRGSEAEIRSQKQPLKAYLTAPFAVDFRDREQTAEHARKPKSVDLKDALLAEKAVLKNMIAAGLSAGSQCGVPTGAIALLEQGSGACFWRPGFEANPTALCAAFHPKVSDHDYEVLIPNAAMGGAACLVDALNTAGEDADIGDVSFFVVSKEEFATARLNIDPPSGGGADVTGDLGLGRQSLLLKWALEGEYVTGVPGLPAPSPALGVVLDRLRTTPIIDGEPTGIPRVEGFEWATLQEYNFYKSKSHVRITGRAVDPKSHLYELQQKEVHDAAKAGIRAAMGRLAADVEGNKLLFVTRTQYQSGGGCLTGTENPSNPRSPYAMFPKVCDSFEEHIASAAVRSLRQGLSVFTENDVKLVYNFYRIKADAACAAPSCTTQITDESSANAFVENTRKFIQNVSAATKGIYDQILASGKDERAAQRLQNAERAEQKRADVAQTAKRTLEDRVLNDNEIEFGVTPLDMYSDAAPGGPAAPWRSYPVPRVQARSETIVDVVRDANGQPIRDDDGRTQKVFVAEVPANETRFVSFVLDPNNTVNECNKQDNFSGFFTYALDPVNPGAVPALPDYPPMPVTFPAPPAECTTRPVPSIEVTKLVNGQPHIKVAPRTPVRITHRIRNTGLVPVEGVQVADLLLQKTYGPFAIAPGQQREVADTYTPTQEGKELIGPSEVLAFTAAGVTAAAWDSIGIDVVAAPCPVAITELDPNPNAYAEGIPTSTVMEGGKAYRYYRITGLATTGGTVTLQVNNRTIVASLDAEGNIVHTEGNATEPGLEIRQADIGEPGAYPVTFVSVNGSTSVCSQPFFVEVTPREFTRGFTAGASIQAAASGGVGIAGKAGVGMGISIDERSGFSRTKLGIDRSINGGIGVQANATPGKAKVLLPGLSGQIGGSAEASLFGVLMLSDNHEFAYAANTDELDAAGSRALGALILSTVAAANGNNPLLAGMLEAVALATDPYPYLTSEAISIGIETSGGASVGALIGLGATDKSRGLEFGNMTYGLGAGAGIGVNASALFGVDLKHKDLEVVPSFTLKASFDLSGFIGEGSVKHSVDEDTKRDVLKLKDDIKASLRGTLGGAIKAKLNLDATHDYRPKKLSLAIATTKDWGWQVIDNRYGPGAGGDPDKITYSYSLSDPATIAKVLDRLVTIRQLTAVRSATGGVGALLGPSQLSDEFEQLLIVLATADAEFDVATERGNGIVLPIGIELGAGARIEASAGLNFDRSIGFTLEKGVVKKGRLFTLEKYAKDDLIPGVPDASDVEDLGHIISTSLQGVAAATTAAIDVVAKTVEQGLNRIRSRNTAELAFDGATAPFTDVAIASFTYNPVAGPVADGLHRPFDITGPADAPHFGVGGYHQFMPKDAQLSAPGALTFFYKDAEVARLDESTLAIYQWNAATENWDHLGGTVDPAANTVTTSVRTLGLFTTAPPLPASRITLSSQTSSAGSPGQPSTSVAYTSGVIRMNTGLVVPDGTLFTVRTLVPATADLLPFGAIITADADPLTDGVQVASQGGVVRFTANYPGAFGSARVLVHAARGVAVGDHVIPYQ